MLHPPLSLPANIETQAPSYASGQFFGAQGEEQRMALLTLSHTPPEDQLYRAMLREVVKSEQTSASFSVRGLSRLTGINSSSTIRRALTGLLRKLSIASAKSESIAAEREGRVYQVFKPEEIFERRRAFGIPPIPLEIEVHKRGCSFGHAIESVTYNNNLSRREAQVALACAEGMTNAEIGRRLNIGEHTVKFHLRNIFSKFGVRRRTELISRLLIREDTARVREKVSE
ncbi:MAG TPA: helix-turn-helix transcriptional regulator [Pyrinomonadaceae bacterium]|nr:helix-turn-helix transcriptional regulator [Pyrinomonadaceae bacterium]